MLKQCLKEPSPRQSLSVPLLRRNVLRTSQLQISLAVNYTIRDAASGQSLHSGSASGTSYVILDTNVQNSEAQALDDAAQRLANNLANEISEGW